MWGPGLTGRHTPWLRGGEEACPELREKGPVAAPDAPRLGGCTGPVNLPRGTCTTSGARMGLADQAPQTKGELWQGPGSKGPPRLLLSVSDTPQSMFRTVSTDRLWQSWGHTGTPRQLVNRYSWVCLGWCLWSRWCSNQWAERRSLCPAQVGIIHLLGA